MASSATTMPFYISDETQNDDAPYLGDLNDYQPYKEILRSIEMVFDNNDSSNIGRIMHKKKNIGSSLFSISKFKTTEKSEPRFSTGDSWSKGAFMASDSSKNIHSALQIEDALLRLIALAYLTSSSVPSTYRHLIEKEVWIPFDAEIIRPFIILTTNTVLFMSALNLSGKSLCTMWYQPGYKQSILDQYNKVTQVFFFDRALEINEPDAIYPHHNCMASSYRSGLDCEWLKPTGKQEYKTFLRNSAMSKNHAPTHISPGSIYSVITPCNYDSHNNSSMLRLAGSNYEKGHYYYSPASGFYSEIFELGKIKAEFTKKNPFSTISIMNAFQGDHFKRDDTGNFHTVIPGKGALKDMVYGGCEAAFNGRDGFRNVPLTYQNKYG